MVTVAEKVEDLLVEGETGAFYVLVLVENLEAAFKESLRLAPYGLSKGDVDRLRAIADGTYIQPRESEARQRLLEKQ